MFSFGRDSKPHLVFVALALLVAISGITGAQSQKPVLHIEVDLQPLDVLVKDANGRYLRGLSAADFKLFENGRLQKISFFDAGSGPVSLAILVDSSSSMMRDGPVGSAQEVAAQFIRIAGPRDQVFSADFSDRIGPFERLTPEQRSNPLKTPAVPPSQGSALYDAIASAICHLSASKNPRQAVIVVTDGIDQHSRLTLDQLISLVRSSPAQLFMIGLQSRPEYRFQNHVEPKLTLISGQDIDNPVVVFDRLMKESSAESFIPDSESGLEQALQAVSNVLQSEYTLAYYPQRRPAEKSLKIRVEVNRDGARVLTRHSIGAGLRGEPIHFEQPACTVSPKFYPHPYELRLAQGPDGATYREDFSDRHTGWPVHGYERYVAGAYELVNLEAPVEQTTPYLITGQNLPLTFQKNVIAAYGPWWTDFRASVTVELVSGAQPRDTVSLSYAMHPAAGLSFRMTNAGYYALLASPEASKTVAAKLVKRTYTATSYKETDLIGWTVVPTNRSKLGVELSVQAVGGEISIFVNGQKVKTARDETYKQGLVGFVLSGPGRATFKALEVKQIN